MQLGYVLFTRQTPANAVLWVVAIVLAMTWLAWIVWRYVERPAQRWVRKFFVGPCRQVRVAAQATRDRWEQRRRRLAADIALREIPHQQVDAA
jgi:peptidoglycan/LPS O-acetylase OafA/YrhL